MKIKKLHGFTLAEALLTVAVIGVIASLTVPAAITKYQHITMVTILQKHYKDLDHNLTLLHSERYYKGTLSRSILSLSNPRSNTLETSSKKFLQEYYNVEAFDTGFSDEYKSIDGSVQDNVLCENDDGQAGTTALLKDGSAICIVPTTFIAERDESGNIKKDEDGKIIYTTTYMPATVYIDVNGPDLPNIGGRDLFKFYIYEDFSVDEVAPNLRTNAQREEYHTLNPCTNSAEGRGCFSRILDNDWKMNY